MRNHHVGRPIASLLACVAGLAACADFSSPTEPLPVTVGDPAPASPATSTAVGGIIVNTSTSGQFDGNGYNVTLDGARKRIIRDDVTISFSTVAAGDHFLALTDLPDNCAVDGSNPQTVTVLEGVTTRWVFDVACSVPGGPSQD